MSLFCTISQFRPNRKSQSRKTSTLIAQKLYRQIHRKYVHAGWISYNTSLADSINSAYRNEKIKEKEQRISDFLNSLQEGKSLLVIDNMEDKEEDTDLLKKLRGMENLTLILTSRMAGMEDFTPVSVDFFGEDDAIRLFRHYYGKACKTNAVREIVNLVQCHTLSVEILAKTAKRDRRDLGDFYKDLVKKGIACPDLTVKSHYEKGSHTMAEYLKKLFTLEKKEPEEIRILQNLALMPTMELPPDELTKWIQTNKNTMENLVDSGWLDYHEETPDHPAGYYMHPLVKETIRLDREAFPESIGTEFVECLRKHTYFEENETHVTVFPKLEIADSVLREMGTRETAEYAVACNCLGHYYWVFGLYDREEDWYKEALAVREKMLGTEHPATATAYNNLGLLYQDQGAYDRAKEYYLKALAVWEKVLGTEHPDTAVTYNNLGLLYQDQGAYDRAEEYYLKALAVREKVLGTEHPATATTYDSFGLLYKNQGAYDRAEEYYLKALAVLEKVLGTEHPDTATIYHNIGALRHAQGDYDGAMEQFLKALRARKKVFGAEHPKVETVLKWISDTYPKTTCAHKQPFEKWLAEHGLRPE